MNRMLPSGMRRETGRIALIVAALTVLVTHPLLWRSAGALPSDLGDPLLNAFILGWDADRALSGFRGLWTAPFFFPMPDTLALSEHLLGVALFTSPVVWVTGNPVLAHNLALLASYVLAGAGMFLLAKSLWGRADAACLAALAFAFAPHRAMHVPHLQVLMSGWMPVSLWGLHDYFATGSRRSLAVFAGAFALTGLSNGYFLYFLAVPVAIVVFARFARLAVERAGGGRWLAEARHDVLRLALASAAILAVIAPVAAAYIRVRQAHGFKRSIGEMTAYAGQWADAVRIPEGLRAWSGLLGTGEPERALFPGLTVIVLAVLSVAALRGRAGRPGLDASRRNQAWRIATYAAVLAAALWMTAGPGMPGPYRLLLQFLPGFDGLRVPARFIVIVALALSVLAGAGAAWLLGRLRRSAAAAVTVLLAAAFVLEGYGGPITMVPFRHDQPTRAALNAWLAEQAPGGLIELPISGPGLAPFTLGYQYNTLRHGHPVVNGYSGYGYGLQDFLGGPGSPLREPASVAGALAGLRDIGVRHVVLHRETYEASPEFARFDLDGLVDAVESSGVVAGPARRFNDALAWSLAPAAARPPADESALVRIPVQDMAVSASHLPERLGAAFDGRLDTRWHTGRPQEGGEWVRLSFPREIDAGRLVILTPPGGVGDVPRDLEIASEAGDGSRITLYAGSFTPFLIRGLAGPAPGSPAVIDLPSNLSRSLWIRQTGRSARWQWAAYELQAFERRPRP